MNKITSKQRAYLTGLGQEIDAIFQVGKNGVTPEITESIDDALEARELIKINVLNNSMMGADQVAEMLSGRTKSIPVQVIGNKIILYRPSRKKPKITLPN